MSINSIQGLNEALLITLGLSPDSAKIILDEMSQRDSEIAALKSIADAYNQIRRYAKILEKDITALRQALSEKDDQIRFLQRQNESCVDDSEIIKASKSRDDYRIMSARLASEVKVLIALCVDMGVSPQALEISHEALTYFESIKASE